VIEDVATTSSGRLPPRQAMSVIEGLDEVTDYKARHGIGCCGQDVAGSSSLQSSDAEEL